MSETSWTKEQSELLTKPRNNSLKFILIGATLVAAVIFVVVNALISNGGTQLFLTVNEYLEQEETLNTRDVRVSGWVIGESIEFTQVDSETSILEFDIVDDLANPTQTLHVVAYNEPLPDLLQHEAQALVEGRGNPSEGAFYANEGGLLLKCPTRYEEGVPVEFEVIN